MPEGRRGDRRARLAGDVRMTGWEMLAVAAARFCAGGIDAVVGSGTLVTFRVLLAVGLPPLTATISNSIGVSAGNVTGVFGLLLPESLQRLNPLKNVLTLAVNTVAGLAYIVVAAGRVNWAAAGLIAGGSLVGGYVGASLGRRLPTPVLRGAIAALGIVAITVLLTR